MTTRTAYTTHIQTSGEYVVKLTMRSLPVSADINWAMNIFGKLTLRAYINAEQFLLMTLISWSWADCKSFHTVHKHVCRGFPSSPLTTQHSMMTLTWRVRCHVMRINSVTDWHPDLFLTSTSVTCFYYEIVTVSMLLSHIRDVHVSMVVVQLSQPYNPHM